MGIFGRGQKNHEVSTFDQRIDNVQQLAGREAVNSAVLLDALATAEQSRETATGPTSHFCGKMYQACMNVLEAEKAGRVEPPLTDEEFGWVSGKEEAYAGLAPDSYKVVAKTGEDKPTDTNAINTSGRKH